MREKVYNKLVRDRIPEIIRAHGEKASFRVLTQSAYLEKLDEKLVEELEEYRTSKDDAHAAEELADLCEVIDALLAAKGISRESFEALRLKKKRERGGFERRLCLEKVEERTES